MGNLHRFENRRRNAIGVENRTTCNQSGRRSKLLALDRFIARKLLKRVAAPKTETMTPRHGVELLEEDGRAPPLRTPNKASIGTRDAKRINELFANLVRAKRQTERAPSRERGGQ